MALFTSLDGIDKDGVRAEVNVQTGTGRVKEIVGRGRQSDDGSYRNVEVVFDPDNPHLKRKVYAMLDTTAAELFQLVQAAHTDQRTVSYRIESQRKRGTDRTVPFNDLKHAEEVVRILAAIDGVFSHEAKTDPVEDPNTDKENPSALAQHRAGQPTTVAPAAPAPTAGVNIDTVLAALAIARATGLPQGIVDAVAAQALLAGAAPNQVVASGSDYATPQMAAAAAAEQFALDHLIGYYSTPASAKAKPVQVEVTDEMIAQAASLALTLLGVADQVQTIACHLDVADRAAPSYRHALTLVLNSVDKRYPFPIGEDDATTSGWADSVAAEAAERLYGISRVAAGELPLPEGERRPAANTDAVTVDTVDEVAEPAAAEETSPVDDEEPLDVADVADLFEATVTPAEFVAPADAPHPADPGFVAPDDALVARLRDLCVTADVTSDMSAISDWLAAKLGNRVARQVHAPVLASFVDFYETAGPDVVRAEVLHTAAA